MPSTSRLAAPTAIDDLLLFRLSVLLATGGAPVIRLCEGRHGITRREWRVLSLLGRHADLSPSQLAEHAHLDRARTSRTIGTLVDKQLLQRLPRPGDRRQATLQLTDAGQALVAEIFPRVRDINHQLLAALSAEQVSLLDGLLDALQAQADGLPPAADLPKADRHRGKVRRPRAD